MFAIPQPDIIAGYNRGGFDGGFVWDPALAQKAEDMTAPTTSEAPKIALDRRAPEMSMPK